MSHVDVPVQEGRRLLINTARSIGYSDALAEQLIDSALWLERRHASGVSMLMVYMLLTRDFTDDQRRPERDSRYGLRSVCPVMAANVWVNRFGEVGPPEGVAGMMGPAAPALMAPTLMAYAASVGRALRLHAYNIQLRYVQNGFEIEGDTFGLYPLVFEDCSMPTGIEFIEPFEMPEPRLLSTIEISKVRMTGGDTLRLSD